MGEKLRISLDGGEIIEVNNVTVHVPVRQDDDCKCTLEFNHTGLQQDLWDWSPEEACIRTTVLCWGALLESVEQT